MATKDIFGTKHGSDTIAILGPGGYYLYKTKAKHTLKPGSTESPTYLRTTHMRFSASSAAPKGAATS